MRYRLIPILALSVFSACAQVATEPVEEPVASARPDLDPEVVELMEAAFLLIEAQKLMPLCEEL